MTTNQLIAMGFPLLTAAAVGITGLFIRRPWAEKRAEDVETTSVLTVRAEQSDSDIQEITEFEPAVLSTRDAAAKIYGDALDEAERLLRSAEQQIQRARRPAAKITSPN
jgi:hypothetical protein